ncbi:MAG TPA: hypothetical protein VKP13_12220 [Nitrospira sp.]|nr:hypothetical protein [Nitrospira sp.]
MRILMIVLAAGLSVSCGTVGAPMPPEHVGVARTIEDQKKRDAIEAQQREAAEGQPPSEPQGQDENLPPLRPVGIR